MNPKKRSRKELDRRIEKMKELGLIVICDDMATISPFNTITIDFSAIDENKFLEHIVSCIYKQGIEHGYEKFRKEFKQLLDI